MFNFTRDSRSPFAKQQWVKANRTNMTSFGKYGKPGVYNNPALSLNNEDSTAVALDSKGRTIISPTGLVTAFGDNRKTVTSAATAEALVASSTACNYVIITAETDNTGVIVVGGPTVVAALATRRGIPLNASDSITLKTDDLANVYIDSTVNGDGVTFLYS